MKALFFPVLIINLFLAKITFAAKDTSTVQITFINKVGNAVLQLGTSYVNPFNEPFTVTRFKFYISAVSFYATNGLKQEKSSSYFLINEEDSASKSVRVPVKVGTYKSISFVIGVDSIKNLSGTQTDALDPMNGMFWTWNSGYIMAKLEATSPLSRSPNQLLEYHIGGFRKNQNTVRRVVLSFANKGGLEVKPNDKTHITIEADINKWFAGSHDLKIADHTACMTPGELAVEYADNYEKMFSIASVSASAGKPDQ